MQREYKTQSFNGKEFRVVRGITHPDYSYHTFEREEHQFREQYWKVQSGDVIFDVGASYGSYTLTAIAMGATVYAFEPEKTVFADLAHNITINDWHSRCFPMNVGMWSSKTSVDMKQYAPHWPAFSITSDYEMETIDHIAQLIQINKLDWIKMDIEGAEEHAIKGGLETIAKFTPRLIIECHNFLDAELSKKIKTLLLSVHNYSFEEIVRDPCIILLATPSK